MAKRSTNKRQQLKNGRARKPSASASRKRGRSKAAAGPDAPRVRRAEVKTRAKQTVMLENLRCMATVSQAARATGIDRWTHYDWYKNDSTYKAAADHALLESTDLLETEARRRAVDGWDEPVFHNGKVVGKVRKKSDTLLIFLLKGRRPEVFREKFEHSGPGGGPIALEDVTKAKSSLADKLASLALRLMPPDASDAPAAAP